MLYKASLVCEGGGLAGVYTAGILDCLIKNEIFLKDCIGVSAGSCNVINYVAKIPGRTIKCQAVKDPKLQYMGLKSFLRCGKIYDIDLCFEEFSEKYFPFDYDAFYNSPMTMEAVAIDVETGKATYIDCKRPKPIPILSVKASSALPFFCDMVEIESKKYLDGGPADSIPFERAKTYGNDKIVVILTKPLSYRRKKPSMLSKVLTKIYYHKYPNLMKAINERYLMYNAEMENVINAAKEGKIFLFAPNKKLVNRMESNYDKLIAAYEYGYKDANEKLEKLIEYLRK